MPVELLPLLAKLMKANPPAAADAPMLAEARAASASCRGSDFDATKLDADFAARVPTVAFDRIMLHFKIGNGDVKE